MIAATTVSRVVAGTSWKMNLTLGEAEDYVDELLALGVPAGVQAFLLPPHTALSTVRDRLPAATDVRIGTQNAHWAAEGAGTGEISMRMVHDAGASIVEIGHSERRACFAETDERVALKVAAALEQGLTPLVCVGEPQAVRDQGEELTHVRAQVRSALALADRAAPEVWFAYEPVWAIGDTGRVADPGQVQPVLDAVREEVARWSGSVACTVLYGGSVEESQVGSLLDGTDVDGLFVGRAGWTAAGFAAVLRRCAEHRPLPVTPAHARPLSRNEDA